jgi:hypothetical protein
MSATKSLSWLDAEPESVRDAFLAKTDRLVQDDQGGLKSPFFAIHPGIVLVGKGGEPGYDRPVLREKRSVLAVVWGRDADGNVRLGLIRQKRPPADDPRAPGDEHEAMTFAQVVMGYMLDGDTVKEGALRERLEEAGQCTVLNVEELSFPLLNLEPNTFATWHHFAFVEVDLSTVDLGHTEEDEFIHGVMYLPIAEVLRRIASGWDSEGASYRGGGTLAVLMIFFARHTEIFTH